jgi:hypothetical protein
MSPPGPAMKPSSDMVTEYSTLPMTYLHQDRFFLTLVSRIILRGRVIV